jgi:hypothetical protein
VQEVQVHRDQQEQERKVQQVFRAQQEVLVLRVQ